MQSTKSLVRYACLLPLVVISALIAGCSDPGSSAAAGKPTLTIAAASDLQVAFSQIAKLFEPTAACRVSLTFGSTGQLVQQIESGLPIDIFAAANLSYLDTLRAKNLLVPDSQQVYVRGHIVLVTSKGSSIDQLGDLLSPDVKHIAIANPSHAPYGVAARQALERAGLWEKLQPKIVLGENVRQALQYVETGNTEAGIVAGSIAQASDVKSITIDESLHDPLDQGLAIIAESHQIELARAFIEFLKGPDGRSIMKKCGFMLPDEIGNATESDPSDSNSP